MACTPFLLPERGNRRAALSPRHRIRVVAKGGHRRQQRKGALNAAPADRCGTWSTCYLTDGELISSHPPLHHLCTTCVQQHHGSHRPGFCGPSGHQSLHRAAHAAGQVRAGGVGWRRRVSLHAQQGARGNWQMNRRRGTCFAKSCSLPTVMQRNRPFLRPLRSLPPSPAPGTRSCAPAWRRCRARAS